MTGSALTPKQARFVEEYPVDLNGAAAAIRAGYAKSGASVQGSRLLANANIRRALSEVMETRSEATAITAEGVLKRLDFLANECSGDDRWNPTSAARALELLGKHLGLFTDRLDVTSDGKRLSIDVNWGGPASSGADDG